jgi:hypothetical protein
MHTAALKCSRCSSVGGRAGRRPALQPWAKWRRNGHTLPSRRSLYNNRMQRHGFVDAPPMCKISELCTHLRQYDAGCGAIGGKLNVETERRGSRALSNASTRLDRGDAPVQACCRRRSPPCGVPPLGGTRSYPASCSYTKACPWRCLIPLEDITASLALFACSRMSCALQPSTVQLLI